MSRTPGKSNQVYMTIGGLFILASIGLLGYVFYLQWQNSMLP